MGKTLEAFYFRATDLWKKLCEQHTLLLDYTFDEYALLLGSEIEKLEEKLKNKKAVVDRIKSLDLLREELVREINNDILDAGVFNASTFLSLMKKHESKTKTEHLSKYNALLGDMIKKIKTQNKRNQLFINKALLSLKEIREGAMGKKTFSTYNAKGAEGQRGASL